MTFNPNIPQPTDLLSNSQVDLLGNNTALNSIFSRNHTALSVAPNSGKHSFVEMVATTTSNANGPIPTPSPGLSSGQGTIYTASVGGSPNQLFYTNGSSGSVYQLTTATTSFNASFGTTPSGWTMLPGGLAMAYGTVNNPNGSGTITYGITFTTICSVLLSSQNDGSHSAFTAWVDGNPGASNLDYRLSVNGTNKLFYAVIGFV